MVPLSSVSMQSDRLSFCPNTSTSDTFELIQNTTTSTSLIAHQSSSMSSKRLKSAAKPHSPKRSAEAPPSVEPPAAPISPLPPAATTATLDYVSPSLVPAMDRRLKTSPERIPTSSLRIRAPPLPLNAVEDLFGPDDEDLTPRSLPQSPPSIANASHSTPSPSASPICFQASFSPGPCPYSPSSQVSSAREQALEEELCRVQGFNQKLQDDVVRLSNLMATKTIEIRICGSPTKRGLPCKNRRGTCPFHSPSGAPKPGCQHFRSPLAPSPTATEFSEEQWQL